jgi:hypothetical protein
MSTFVRPVVRLVVTGTAALALLIAPAVSFAGSAPEASAQPCYTGVVPWGPFIPSCTAPGPVGPKVRGGAPDANAIIACRNHPGCLSWYVNGPY